MARPIQRVLQDHPLLRAPGAISLKNCPIRGDVDGTGVTVPATLWDILEVGLLDEDEEGLVPHMVVNPWGWPERVGNWPQQWALELVVQPERGDGRLIRMRSTTAVIGWWPGPGWYPAHYHGGDEHLLPASWTDCRLAWERHVPTELLLVNPGKRVRPLEVTPLDQKGGKRVFL